MKKAYSIIALLLVLVMAMSGMSVASAEATDAKAYVVGDTMDDFTIKLTDGTDVTLSELLKTHKAVLINIFGGITRCDEVAGGVKLAMEHHSLDGKLIVVRMEGTNKNKGVEIIESLRSDVVRTEGLRESIAALLERRDRL